MTSNERLPRKGDRYVVHTAFKGIVTTQWFAPCSGGELRDFPHALEFEVMADLPEGATAIIANPLEYESWQRELVSEDEYTDELYGGYGLTITLDQLAANCRNL